MTKTELAREIAKGLIETGIEGGFGSVTCSTAGDYPSMGVSQWEGRRGDMLLLCIDGGEKFIDRSYSDIVSAGELEELEELLDSEQGHEAQMMVLAADCEIYVEYLWDIISDCRCIIYAGMWCPTSHHVVRQFLKNRAGEYDLDSLEALCEAFSKEYAVAADCGEYQEGYYNRANVIYDYLAGLNLMEYGEEAYDG